MNVLIATHGRPARLVESLRSVLAAATNADVRKIVVVENGGDFGTREICERLDFGSRLRVISVPIANKSVALNRGLSECDDELIFMTDDDILLPPDLLTTYESAAKDICSGAYFGGDVTPVFESDPKDSIRGFLPKSARASNVDGDVHQYFLGANWAAYKRDLVAAGGFSPDFGPGSRTGATGQETEMQRRLHALGCTPVYLPSAAITHFVPKECCTEQWVLKRAFRIGVERGLTIASNTAFDVDRELGQRVKHLKRTRLHAIIYPSAKRKLRYRFTREVNRGIRHGIDHVLGGNAAKAPFLEGTSGTIRHNLQPPLGSSVSAVKA